jgi:hypothetical protein
MEKVILTIRKIGNDETTDYTVSMPDGKVLKTFKDKEEAFDWAWEQEFCDEAKLERQLYTCVCGYSFLLPRDLEETHSTLTCEEKELVR